MVCLAHATANAQALPAAIGQISGDEMTVTGAANFTTSNGRSAGLLSNGSEITLPFGQAKIELADGGEIDICAPAHFTLLKAGGAITIALDYGRVHAQLDSDVPLTIYTPLIVATPVAIGEGRRDITIGLDQKDVMCALAQGGAARIQQQFSGQAILLPQGGELNLTSGQLDGAQMGSGGCQCELPVAHDAGPGQLDLRAPIRPIAPPNSPAAMPPISPSDLANEGVEMRVDMPPLAFSSSGPAPPPGADPQTMLLVREIRVQPGVVYQGIVTAVAEPPATPAKSQTKSQKPGFWARLFGRHASESN
jgi:hypothetical protein